MTKILCKDTLLIKNLPPELSDAEKKDLLTHFGGKTVKIITSKYKQKSKAYVKFESEDVAKNVMLRLHQMNILESRLCVEFAEEEIGCDQSSYHLKHEDGTKYFNTFLNKLNSWNVAVNFHQPPPPHLKYLYPKPNRATINNIAHALASVPKFYTQVLHLMNKMNLPPPFSNIPDPPEKPIPPPAPPQQQQQPQQQPPPPTTKEPSTPKKSSSESELESDPEDQKIVNIIPMKRTKAQRKFFKKPKFIKPPVIVPTGKTQQDPDEIFEKSNLQNTKKIELNISENLDPKTDVSEETIEGFGIIKTQRETASVPEMETQSEEEVVNKVITEDELASNRISPKDFGVLPVFKDYHPGAPSCRIYIKNLAKNVELTDLNFIYKRYDKPDDSEQGNMFDVRLMQEGRMKGQAFVTLQNVTLAQQAVKETNGFILKNKPLVVVFARSAVPKTKI